MANIVKGYCVEFRLDTDDTKEFRRAFVMASNETEARVLVEQEATNGNEREFTSVCIYTVEEVKKGTVFDCYVQDMKYRFVECRADL